MNFREDFKAAYNSILDFIFPRVCIGCGRINPTGSFPDICTRCALDAENLRGARCKICSEIVGEPDQPDVEGCSHCIGKSLKFGHSMVSSSFAGIPRKLVIELKYRRGERFLRDMSVFMQDTRGLEMFVKDAVLVPVPLHFSRRFSRPYNQSELIAKTIVKTFPNSGCRVLNILRRTRRTTTQTALDKSERAANISGAFSVRRNCKLGLNTRIVVVDDVMTTAATLSECADTLRKFGFQNVDAYAFARRL